MHCCDTSAFVACGEVFMGFLLLVGGCWIDGGVSGILLLGLICQILL
jgi:hypothetical protein